MAALGSAKVRPFDTGAGSDHNSAPLFCNPVAMMTFSRRFLLKAGLAAAASAALHGPGLAQSAHMPFAQWVESFRSRARARGISDATYRRVMGSLKPDMTVYDLDKAQPEF